MFSEPVPQVFWLSITTWSRIFHLCSLVPIIPVSHFQSPVHIMISCTVLSTSSLICTIFPKHWTETIDIAHNDLQGHSYHW